MLDREHDNFRAALHWSVTQSPGRGVALVASLWRFWFLRGHTSEGADWVERALAAAHDPDLTYARALVGLTCLDARRGRSDRVRLQAAEAVAIAERVADAPTTVMFRLVHATLIWCTLEVAEAERMAGGVERDARELGRPDLLAGSIWLRSMCALTSERGELAGRLLHDCLAQLDRADPDATPFLPVVTPCVLLVPVAGRMVPSFEESLIGGRRVGVTLATGYARSALGYAARLAGDLPRARAEVGEAVSYFTSVGDDLGRVQALHHLGCVMRDQGDFGVAEQTLTEAWTIRRALGDRRGATLARSNLALAIALHGDVDEGRRLARECLTDFEAVEDRPAAALGHGTLANIELAAGRPRAALEMYQRAVTLFTTQSWPRSQAWHRLMAAEVAAELGDEATARLEVDRAETLFAPQACALAAHRVRALQQVLGPP